MRTSRTVRRRPGSATSRWASRDDGERARDRGARTRARVRRRRGRRGVGAEDPARLAAAAIAASGDFDHYGFFTSSVCGQAIASTTGLRASQRTTDATCLALAAADGASGYAMRTAWRAGEIDPAAVAEEAAEKASRTRGGQQLEPTRYRAVLEPYAISELLYYFSFDTFN